ncbi:hypothetical protein V8C86DRAFT_3036170 [Haematococcus lacustris]
MELRLLSSQKYNLNSARQACSASLSLLQAVSKDRRGASDNWTLHQTRRVMWEPLSMSPLALEVIARRKTHESQPQLAAGAAPLNPECQKYGARSASGPTSVAAVSRGEARMSKTCMDLNVKI